MRNYLKRENGNIKEDATEIDTHHTSMNGRRMEDKPKSLNTQTDKKELW